MIRQISITLLLVSSLMSIQAQDTQIQHVAYVHLPAVDLTKKNPQVATNGPLKFELSSMIVSEEIELHFEQLPPDLELNIAGRQLTTPDYQVIEVGSKTMLTINIEELMHGAYTLQIKSNGRVYTEKIVKT